jgi:HAE1 family hydrophobic/amphiphilic exporter-1
MTDLPSYRKVNPADAPVLFMTMNSPSMNLSELNDYAENLVAPAHLDAAGRGPGVGQRRQKFAVRVRAKTDLMNARNLTMDELAASLRTANSNAARHPRRPAADADHPGPPPDDEGRRLRRTDRRHPQRPAGAPEGRGHRRGQLPVDQGRPAPTTASARSCCWCSASPTPTPCRWSTHVRKLLPRFQSQLPASIKINLVNDRSLSIREAIHDVNFTLALTVGWWCW